MAHKSLAVLALMPITLAGCGDKGEVASASDTASEAMICNADPVQSFVGQKATQALGAEILAKSGARTLRWGGPATAWTMDLRQDRVNVQYDQDMIIKKISCG